VRLRAITSLVVVLLAASGCRQLAGLGDPGSIDGAGGDDGVAGPLCFGTGLVKVCFDATPTGDLSLAVAVNTDATTSGCATNVTSGGDGLCVIDAKTITVPAGLVASATGSKPLVIVGAETITIDGTVDVSSKHMSGSGTHGGGADFSACVVPTSPASMSDGGGAGGSFAGMGGDGGDPSHASATAGLGEPTTLHGGCSGGSGADNMNRGHSGGGVALIAVNHIDVMGQVDASGAGGSNQNDFVSSLGGGGGGGSGGMIILDAATITIGGIVFANGGGGGEGATTSNPGHSGNDPANGGVGMGGTGSAGGDGGNGGAATTPDGAPGGAGVLGSLGGGGGGGSVGVIRIYGERTVSGGTISPPAP